MFSSIIIFSVAITATFGKPIDGGLISRPVDADLAQCLNRTLLHPPRNGKFVIKNHDGAVRQLENVTVIENATIVVQDLDYTREFLHYNNGIWAAINVDVGDLELSVIYTENNVTAEMILLKTGPVQMEFRMNLESTGKMEIFITNVRYLSLESLLAKMSQRPSEQLRTAFDEFLFTNMPRTNMEFIKCLNSTTPSSSESSEFL